MSRRGFLKGLFGITLLPLVGKAQAATPERKIILQTSPIAGFQYYEGEALFQRLSQNDPLELRREPTNPYDKKAVEVYWQGHKLGYLPRAQNHAVSQMLDDSNKLATHITVLGLEKGPWQRIELQVAVVLDSVVG